jgi:hypothetical protein
MHCRHSPPWSGGEWRQWLRLLSATNRSSENISAVDGFSSCRCTDTAYRGSGNSTNGCGLGRGEHGGSDGGTRTSADTGTKDSANHAADHRTLGGCSATSEKSGSDNDSNYCSLHVMYSFYTPSVAYPECRG